MLIALEYWREYRTQFHIRQNWGIHATTVGRIVRKVGDILIRAQTIRLPGKKRLLQPQVQHCVLLMDVIERAIDRQKNSVRSTVVSQIRIKVEHINLKLKIFRILSERYRNQVEAI